MSKRDEDLVAAFASDSSRFELVQRIRCERDGKTISACYLDRHTGRIALLTFRYGQNTIEYLPLDGESTPPMIAVCRRCRRGRLLQPMPGHVVVGPWNIGPPQFAQFTD